MKWLIGMAILVGAIIYLAWCSYQGFKDDFEGQD